MKKSVGKIILSCLAATFVMGTSMAAYAATGWQYEDNTWRYYERGGDAVENAWRKSGSSWYWLDENGDMATETLVEDDDDLYYVNENGVMIVNQWIQLENEDRDDDNPTCWYYFGANGKAYKAPDSGKTTFKTIAISDGSKHKYAFDSACRMLYGWVDDQSTRITEEEAWKSGTYFMGGADDGALAANQWVQLDVEDSENEDEDFVGKYWFYFKANGKKVADTTSTINGKKYRFGEYGNAYFKWYQMGTGSTASPSTLFYSIPEDCWLSTGWFKTIPGEDIDAEEHAADTPHWFYAKKDGELLTSQIKKINGRYYGFDRNGLMLEGLYKLSMDDKTIVSYEKIETFDDLPNEDEGWDVYYFASSSVEGAMASGNVILNVDGENYTFKFQKSGSERGAGYNGIHDGSIYIKGRLLKADKWSKLEIVTYEDEQYLINTSGKIQKNKKNVKDGDDVYYCTDASGVVTYTGSEKYTED